MTSFGDRPIDRNVRDLILRCLDGFATDEDVARLDVLVASDANVARTLAAAARFESCLEVLSGAALKEVPLSAYKQVSRSRARPMRLMVLSFAVAAAAGVIAWFAFKPNHRLEVATSPSPRTLVVAKATASSAIANAPRHLRFADGSTAELLNANARIESRESMPNAVELTLVEGSARFEVIPRTDRRFRVWIGGTSSYVDVLGTIFSVEPLGTRVRVSVERGIVRVVSGGHETRIGQGKTETVALDLLPDAPRVAQGHADSRGGGSRVRTQAGAVTNRSVAAPDQPGVWLLASEDARRAGRPEDAIALLRRLIDAYPNDARAPYAAFILGRVLLEETSRPREAAAAFERVATLDPRTPLVQDALAREVEAWSRAGDPARAQQQARAYLERFPKGARLDEVRRYGHME